MALLDVRFNWQCVYRTPAPEVKETKRLKRDSYLLRRGDRQPLNKFLCGSWKKLLHEEWLCRCNPFRAMAFSLITIRI